MSTNNGHSTLGPSSAKRWMSCPGSVALSAQVPALPASQFAAEGTVAHQLAEAFATGAVDSLDLMGRVGTVVKQDGFDIEITDEMVDGAIEYRDTIAADRAALEKDKRPAAVIGKAELRVHASSVDELVWGTADYILYRKGHALRVYDYKYGKGVTVEARENAQMALYAVGAMDTEAGHAFGEIEVVVVQPRASHAEGTVRRWKVSSQWLAFFKNEARLAAKATQQKGAKLAAGDWCRWCPAAGVCPELHKAAAKEARADFDEVPDGRLAKMEARLPEVRLMTDEQLVKAFQWEDTVGSFFEAVRAVLTERLSTGTAVPGIKLVDGRSNRQWVDEGAVVKEFSAVLGEKLYEPKKILSPAKLEKVVGKGRPIDHLTFKPEGRKSIALDKDPRPVARSSAKDDFTVVGQDPLDDLISHPLPGPTAISGGKKVWP